MQIETLILGTIEENCFIVYDKGRTAAVIDPGDEAAEILSLISEESLTLGGILLTHGHFDHIGAVTELRHATGAKVYLHQRDQMLVDNAQAQALMFGLKTPPGFKADHYIKDGDLVEIGELKFSVLHTPGHTQGSVCFYTDGALFAGDTLFHSGIGRTDLPGGSYEDIMSSIAKIFKTYSGDVRVCCGHGPPTTLAREKLQNPFLQNFSLDSI